MNYRVRRMGGVGCAPAALSGRVAVPGDKSIGHRAVLFAGIGNGTVTVDGLSGGQDNQRTMVALRQLGATITERSPFAITVTGCGPDGLRAPGGDLDCGNSGTSMRLLAGLLGGQHFASRLTGDTYLEARPMRRVAAPLSQMGVKINGRAGKKPAEIYPPLHIEPAEEWLHGITYTSPVASAQVKSAILLAGLYADGSTTVMEPERSRDHTERMLAAFGVPITVEGNAVTLDPTGWDRRLLTGDLVVPGDPSSAAFLLGAATIVPGSDVTIVGVLMNPTRTGFFDALQQMGADLTFIDRRVVGGEEVADIQVRAVPRLRGISIGGELAVRALDELPLLGALAAFADGETIVADAAELRVKESDRVLATVTLCRAFGAQAEERPDGFIVRGQPTLRGATVQSFGDHRIAMAAAVLAQVADGESCIVDVHNVATSFPTFQSLMIEIGAVIVV